MADNFFHILFVQVLKFRAKTTILLKKLKFGVMTSKLRFFKFAKNFDSVHLIQIDWHKK